MHTSRTLAGSRWAFVRLHIITHANLRCSNNNGPSPAIPHSPVHWARSAPRVFGSLGSVRFGTGRQILLSRTGAFSPFFSNHIKRNLGKSGKAPGDPWGFPRTRPPPHDRTSHRASS